MSNEVIVFADATEILIGYLNAAIAELDADVLDGVTVTEKVPKDRPLKFVTLRRGGGVRTSIVTDNPTLLVEAWAQSSAEAHDIAQIVRALLHAVAGTVQGGVAIYKVDEFAGPAELPDPISEQPRYVFTVSASFRGSAL